MDKELDQLLKFLAEGGNDALLRVAEELKRFKQDDFVEKEQLVKALNDLKKEIDSKPSEIPDISPLLASLREEIEAQIPQPIDNSKDLLDLKTELSSLSNKLEEVSRDKKKVVEIQKENTIETRVETIKLYEEMVVSLDKLGILPDSTNCKVVQELVLGENNINNPERLKSK